MRQSVQVVYTRLAVKELKKLPKAIVTRILKRITKNVSKKENIFNHAKALTGQFTGCYRYRIGDYRAIFVVDKEGNVILLTILSIKHRKDVYRRQ